MNTSSALFLSLSAACAGFALLRLSLKDAWKDVGFPNCRVSPGVCRIGAALLLFLSALVWVPAATSLTVGWMSWLFCTLGIAPIALVALWPFNPRMAAALPVLMLGLLALIAWIV